MVAGLLVVAAATPAMAQDPPPASLHPDEDGLAGGGIVGNRLSDRSDGTDQAAHLTAVAPPATDRVQWRLCPTATAPPLDQADLAACNIIVGEDTTAETPGVGGGFAPTPDEAYGITYDIPVTENTPEGSATGTRDVAVLACIGAGENLAAGGNCVGTLEEGIFLDDASTADPDTTSGEMTQICTNNAGPGASDVNLAANCLYDINQDGVIGPADNDTAAEQAAVDANFGPFIHGDAVPNNGFVLRATTSTDLTTNNSLASWITGPVTSSAEPDPLFSADACQVRAALATQTNHECYFGDGAVPDDTAQAVMIGNLAAGQGFCAGGIICQLDSHFIVSQARVAAKVAAYFVKGNATWPNADVTTGSSCGTPDTADRNQLSDVTLVLGCVQDQFGQPFSTNVTFESNNVGEVTDTDAFSPEPGGASLADPCDRLHDHPPADDPRETEHCHKDAATPLGVDGVPATADSWARYSVLLDNDDNIGPGGTPLDQVVTFCVDPENGGTEAAPPAQHGCADEPANLKTTVTKTWRALPDHIHLVFLDTATDPDDPCHTGDRSAENKVGDTDELLVCTFDDTETGEIPATTAQDDGGRINWFITPSGGGEKTATRFKGTPPSETDATTAQATATIRAFRRGNDNIRVDLEDSEGVTVVEEATDQVQKRVTRGKRAGGRAESSVSIRGSFKGQVASARTKCKVNRKVFLKRKRPGKDQTIGTDRTNGAGNWKERVNNPSGRYYAKINRTKRCKGDRSPTIRK